MAFMAINIAVFVWMMIQDSSAGSGDVTRTQVDLGLYAPFLKFDHEWYRLITSGFVHFGVIHLAFNMFALYLFGSEIERLLGTFS
jgi:membrane associated rhomboid family serine protease